MSKVSTSLADCMEDVAWKVPQGQKPYRIEINGLPFFVIAETGHKAMKAACTVRKCSSEEVWDALHLSSLERKNANKL